MSGHFYLPFVLPFSTFLIVGGALSRRYPRLRRPFAILAGLLLVGMGLAMTHFFPGQGAPGLFRWVAMACGAAIALASSLNWLPVKEDDTPLRPDTGRPPRHFGETS
jgi:peptidoglycan/LPS O-acetylase OafA/YrhL